MPFIQNITTLQTATAVYTEDTQL